MHENGVQTRSTFSFSPAPASAKFSRRAGRTSTWSAASGLSHRITHNAEARAPLSATALTLLLRMREHAEVSEQFLFSGNARAKPLQGIMKYWRGVTEQIGLRDYRLHDNRHTHASHLASSHLSLEIVRRLLGNTNPLTPKRYADLADDALRTATDNSALRRMSFATCEKPRSFRYSQLRHERSLSQGPKAGRGYLASVTCALQTSACPANCSPCRDQYLRGDGGGTTSATNDRELVDIAEPNRWVSGAIESALPSRRPCGGAGCRARRSQ